jgi:hypothetical protein
MRRVLRACVVLPRGVGDDDLVSSIGCDDGARSDLLCQLAFGFKLDFTEGLFGTDLSTCYGGKLLGVLVGKR